MILSTTPPNATLYSIVNVIGKNLTPGPFVQLVNGVPTSPPPSHSPT